MFGGGCDCDLECRFAGTGQQIPQHQPGGWLGGNLDGRFGGFVSRLVYCLFSGGVPKTFGAGNACHNAPKEVSYGYSIRAVSSANE